MARRQPDAVVQVAHGDDRVFLARQAVRDDEAAYRPVRAQKLCQQAYTLSLLPSDDGVAQRVGDYAGVARRRPRRSKGAVK